MDEISNLYNRIAELERRMDNVVRHGRAAEVNTADRTVRVEVGREDGEPFLSPPIPYSQQAGAFKGHVPPTVGQNMTVFSPSGEYRQAVAVPMTWNNANPSPGSGADPVWTYGQVRLEVKETEIVLSIGDDTKITIKDDRLFIESPLIKTIGKTVLGLDDDKEGDEPPPPPRVMTEGGPAGKTFAKVGNP